MQVLIVAGTAGRSTCFLPAVFRFFSRGSKMEDRMESDPYQRSEHSTDEHALELLHRALTQGDQEAWEWIRHYFSDLVLGWLHRHPNRILACRLEREDTYVAQAFERFWQATSLTKRREFSTLAAALQYLRACLNGAILDTLRAGAQLREILLPEPGEAAAPYAEDTSGRSDVWEILQTILTDHREQQLAYLFFQCGLGPREIVGFCPQEFGDIYEIYQLRRSIIERLLRNAEKLRWQL